MGEAEGLAEWLVLVADGLVTDVLAVAETGAVDGGDDGRVVDVAAGRDVWSPGAVAGLNVATDSIAPATRHTASTLATSGMMVPCPAKGPASRRSRCRRRFARSSRWYASTSRSSSRASSGIWMSSGGSSHPDPPPGFTFTSGANWILGIQYDAMADTTLHR